MLDEFELSNRFKELLSRHLSASQISRIGTFAYAHYELYPQLFERIMTTLEHVTVCTTNTGRIPHFTRCRE